MVNLLRTKPTDREFEHPLVIRQTNLRSRLIIWLLMGSTATLVLWANFAKIEEAISVQGKLEPQGAAKEIQVPVSGVINQIHVQEGQTVKAGDRLVSLDTTTATAELKSLQQVRASLVAENRYYQSQLEGTADLSSAAIAIPPAMLNLTKSRSAILAETRLAEAQINGVTGSSGLSSEQQARLRAEAAESQTRQLAAQLEVQQIQQQIPLLAVKQAAAANALSVETRILNDISPLAAAGAISRIQLLKQQQVKDQKQAEVDEYAQEQIRIEATIAQAQARAQNTQAVDTKEFTGRIGDNTQQLAAIDAQITKVVVENNKRIAEIDSQISQSQQILQYGEVKAPVSGLVFNLKPNAVGYVASPNAPIVTIVPTDQLIAKVAISNKDIGFVQADQAVDVRIDAFPFSEFGDVKGTVLSIGADALPPTPAQPFYVFPAKIQLNQQTIAINGKVTQLQPGMSVSANVRLRQRTVMSIFTDMFTKTAESLKLMR